MYNLVADATSRGSGLSSRSSSSAGGRGSRTGGGGSEGSAASTGGSAGSIRSGMSGSNAPSAASSLAAELAPQHAQPAAVSKPAQRKETPTLQVRQRPRLATGLSLQWQQLAALTRKNLTIRARAWKTNLLVVAQAVLFIFLIWAVDKAVSASRQRQPAFSQVEVAVQEVVKPVPDCSTNRFMRHGQPCHTFLYAPAGDPAVEAVVAAVIAHNDPPIPPEHVMGLESSAAVDAWMLQHPETVLAAVIFSPDNSSSGAGAGSSSSIPVPASTAAMPDSTLPAAAATNPALSVTYTTTTNSSSGGSGGGINNSSSDVLPTGMLLGTPGLPGATFPTAAGPATPAVVPATLSTAAASPARRPRQLPFYVQTNSSVQWFKGAYQHPNTYIQLPLQVAVEREVVRYLASNSSLGWSVALVEFPHPTAQSPSMIGQFAPTFLFASIMFQFVLLVHDVVQEKEGRVRQMMDTMGLRPLPFWASWVLFQGVLAVIEACLLTGFGHAFGFRLFTVNDPALSFLLLLLVCLSMTAFGFFVSAFLSRASAAVPAGFLLFVVAWVLLIVVAFGFPFSSPDYSTVAVSAFSSMPWTLLAKGVQDLALAAEGHNGGISWADRNAYCQPGTSLSPDVELEGSYWKPKCVMPLGQMYWILAVQCAGFMALAVYLDAVLPDANGVCLPPWFFLLPSYWRRSNGRGGLRAAAAALAAPTEEECGLAVDADVAAEQRRQRTRCAAYLRRLGGGAAVPSGPAVLPAELAVQPARFCCGGGGSGTNEGVPVVGGMGSVGGAVGAGVGLKGADSEGHAEHADLAACGDGGEAREDEAVAAGGGRPYAVEMFGLKKVFKRGWLPGRRRPFVAVRGNWLGVYQGECFCLLGPNGAGKSTTINCLTGVVPFDGGDALVCGHSIAAAGGMDRVRSLIGVCPQFDVLWDQLTGREHLLLFGAIKGLPASERWGEAGRLLEDVRLGEAGGVRAGAYSGGMRRRLSVAIALLGDPQVVFLDEPTTGLDPISRRHLWDLVDRAKRDRAVILTTHSMEEADILGDRIGIMARGRLRCIGTSLRLKSRFGSGYRVSVRVQGSSSSASSATPRNTSDNSSGGDGSGSARGGAWSGEIQPASASSGRSGAAQQAQQAAQQQQPARLDPVAASQAAAVRQLFLQHLGIKPSDESPEGSYLHFLVPYEHEDRLPALFSHIKAHQSSLGVEDLQLRLTPLEEVFLAVARKAELEHAQLEGRHETLVLAEEGIALKVPIGAEFIQSPAGHLYHIRWGQDPDTGELKLQDYWRDPLSSVAAAAGAAGAGSGSSSPPPAAGSSTSAASAASAGGSSRSTSSSSSRRSSVAQVAPGMAAAAPAVAVAEVPHLEEP